ncbi:MAG: ABC transporter permease [Chloroflexota bacterium]
MIKTIAAPANLSEHAFAETPFLTATQALMRRWWWRYKRQPFTIVLSLIQPAIWLLLFSNLFAHTATTGAESYLSFMTAGVIVMTVFNGALGGGVNILFDKETGLLKRMMVAPIPPLAILASRFAFVLVISTVQVLLIVLSAILLGVEIATGVGGICLILLVGVLIGMGITALSIALAYFLPGHGQFFAITGFVSLPLIFTSNALAPLEQMPMWLQSIARLNPLTHAISSVRSLILDGMDWSLLLQMSGVIILFDLLMILLCVKAMHRVFDR